MAIQRFFEEPEREEVLRSMEIGYICFDLYCHTDRGSEEKLMEAFGEMEDTCRSRYDMKINKHETKVSVVSNYGTQTQMTLQGRRLQKIDEFVYLGSKGDLVSRVNQSNNINMELRKQLMKTYAWSVFK